MALRWRRFWRKFRRTGPLMTTLLLLIACNRGAAAPTPPAPTAQSEATPAATTTPVPPAPTIAASPPAPTVSASVALPTVTPTSTQGSAAQGAIFSSPRFSYTVVLPCCWVALPTAGTAIESALAELEAETDEPVWGDLGDRLRGRDDGAVLELIGVLPDAENLALPVAQVTVSVLPAFGLTLDEYLAATSSELGEIANTDVLTAYIESTLGVGGFPASVIEYTATPSPASDEIADERMAGLQVAFFGHDDATLIVLTFTTTVDRYPDLQPEFLDIVRTMTLEGTPV